MKTERSRKTWKDEMAGSMALSISPIYPPRIPIVSPYHSPLCVQKPPQRSFFLLLPILLLLLFSFFFYAGGRQKILTCCIGTEASARQPGFSSAHSLSTLTPSTSTETTHLRFFWVNFMLISLLLTFSIGKFEQQQTNASTHAIEKSVL